MNFYLAPLEGITGDIFRKAIMEVFGEGVSALYAPFISPCDKVALAPRDRLQLLPENNAGYMLVPQILSVKADETLLLEKELMDLGYTEYNLNFGCPSPTVSNKGRGAGFLTKPEELDRFLDELYAGTKCKVSVKTRLGFWKPEEFEEILKIYDRYPISELIIHVRTRQEFYKGPAHVEWFEYAMKNTVLPLGYNGDIYTKEDYEALKERMDVIASSGKTGQMTSVMMGRGMLRDPSLIRQLSGGAPATKEEIASFLRILAEDYTERFSGDTPVLFKMKELWTYLIASFPGQEKGLKKIRKSTRMSDYKAALYEMGIEI